jgi:hypothetical protein
MRKANTESQYHKQTKGATMVSEPRIIRLRDWMSEHFITYGAIAKHLGITVTGARWLVSRETIPVERYHQLIELGFPEALLPQPLDIPPGPRPKEPRFPGLMGTGQEANPAP